jgi:type II secretory pathway component PulJ
MKLLIALFFLAVISLLFFEALRLMSEDDVPSVPSVEMLVPGR